MIVVFEGRLGRDPELREAASSGKQYWYYTVAVNEYASGNRTTLWLSVKDFDSNRKIYETAHKGSGVLITGDMQPPSIYNKKDGTQDIDISVFVNSITYAMSSGKDGDDAQAQQESASSSKPQSKPAPAQPQAAEEPHVHGNGMNDFQQPDPQDASGNLLAGDNDDLPF